MAKKDLDEETFFKLIAAAEAQQEAVDSSLKDFQVNVRKLKTISANIDLILLRSTTDMVDPIASQITHQIDVAMAKRVKILLSSLILSLILNLGMTTIILSAIH